jgi:predicted nucleic acid-binding protein
MVPMRDLFADTSGWGHLFDATQDQHDLASSIYRAVRQQGHRVITTNYVLAELVALLTSPLRVPRPQLIALIRSMKSSPFVEVIHVDESLDEQAWQLLAQRQDKQWSLVDCASFVVMRQRGVFDALTTDHHFEQAGYVRLLKPATGKREIL